MTEGRTRSLLGLEECQEQNILSLDLLAEGVVSQITALVQALDLFLFEMGFVLHNH